MVWEQEQEQEQAETRKSVNANRPSNAACLTWENPILAHPERFPIIRRASARCARAGTLRFPVSRSGTEPSAAIVTKSAHSISIAPRSTRFSARSRSQRFRGRCGLLSTKRDPGRRYGKLAMVTIRTRSESVLACIFNITFAR